MGRGMVEHQINWIRIAELNNSQEDRPDQEDMRDVCISTVEARMERRSLTG